MKFNSNYGNRPKFETTPNSGISNVDASSYVPTVDLVDSLVRGGITIEANRRFQYQYGLNTPPDQIRLERHEGVNMDTITREGLIQKRIAELKQKHEQNLDAIRLQKEAELASQTPVSPDTPKTPKNSAE